MRRMNPMHRLETVSGELNALISSAGPGVQRGIGTEVASAAWNHVAVQDAAVDEVVEAINAGQVEPDSLSAAVRAAAALDDAYFVLADDAGASEEGAASAFAVARAAASVVFAAGPHAEEAAIEATYEAVAVLGVEAVSTLVSSIVQREAW